LFLNGLKKILAICLFVLATACVAGNVNIVQNNQSEYQILIGDDEPLHGLRTAATELQTYIKKMTGVELPISLETEVTSPHFFALRQSLYCAPGGYLMACAGNNNIYIIGNTYQPNTTLGIQHGKFYHGTLNGVYDFLREFGCEWYWAGEYGEIVPKLNKLSLKSFFYKIAQPSFTYCIPYKGPTANNGETCQGIWAIRQGALNTLGLIHGHGWGTIMGIRKTTGGIQGWCRDCDDVPDDEPLVRCGHPEYMAMTPGPTGTHLDFYGINEYDSLANRSCSMASSGKHGGQVCTSNPGTVKAFDDYIQWYFDRNPTKTCLSVSPNDGGGFCECLECQKQDGSIDKSTLYGDLDGDSDVDLEDFGVWQTLESELQNQIEIDNFTWTGGKPWDDSLIRLEENPVFYKKRYLTDRILTFYNKLAEALVLHHPDRYLSGYIYTYYSLPPRREHQIHDNLYLCHAHNSSYRLPSETVIDKFDTTIEHFASKANNRMFCHDIACWRAFGMPQPLGRAYVDRLKKMYENGYQGSFTYLDGDWENFGPWMYLFMKLHRDPYQDANALLEKYYKDLYGPASVHVKRYYENVLERREQVMRNFFQTSLPQSVRGLSPYLGAQVYASSDLSYLDKCISAVSHHKDECDANMLERYNRLERSWRLAKSTVETCLAEKEALDNPMTTQAWQKFKNAFDTREDVKREISQTTYGRTVVGKANYAEWLERTDWLSRNSRLYLMPRDELKQEMVYCSDMDELDVDIPVKWYFSMDYEIVEKDGSQCLKCVLPDNPMQSGNFTVGAFKTIFQPLQKTSRCWLQMVLTAKIEDNQAEMTSIGNFWLRANYRLPDGSKSDTMRHMNAYDLSEWITLGVLADVSSPVEELFFNIYAKGGGTLYIDKMEVYLYTEKLSFETPLPLYPFSARKPLPFRKGMNCW